MSAAMVVLFARGLRAVGGEPVLRPADPRQHRPVLRGASQATAGLVVTFSQIGYAVGLALLVPLGDILTRRRLVPLVLR